MSRRSTMLDRQRRFDEANLIAAKAILENVDRHGGEGSGPVLWARMCLSRLRDEEAAA